MARKSAIQKIEAHEKLCRIMQKQTFEQIKEMKERIKRIEYMIVGGMGSLILALLSGIVGMKNILSPLCPGIVMYGAYTIV